MMFSKKWHR